MRQIDITIDYSKLYSSIALNTGYVGKAVSEDIDNITVTEDENKIVDDLINNSVNELIANIPKYNIEFADKVISFQVPSNFDDSILSTLTQTLESYIINKSLAGWFALIQKNLDFKQYIEKADSLMLKIKKLLTFRKKYSIK